jgi:hypothetical protein
MSTDRGLRSTSLDSPEQSDAVRRARACPLRNSCPEVSNSAEASSTYQNLSVAQRWVTDRFSSLLVRRDDCASATWSTAGHRRESVPAKARRPAIRPRNQRGYRGPSTRITMGTSEAVSAHPTALPTQTAMSPTSATSHVGALRRFLIAAGAVGMPLVDPAMQSRMPAT